MYVIKIRGKKTNKQANEGKNPPKPKLHMNSRKEGVQQNPNVGISIDDGNCCVETDVNGSWKEAAGSAAERCVTNRQRGLSEFIYRICPNEKIKVYS
jgi:hypothetical protein